jgi:hypothetical protein
VAGTTGGVFEPGDWKVWKAGRGFEAGDEVREILPVFGEDWRAG